MAGKTSVIDCGVDLERFAPGDALAARTTLGWQPEGPAFVCVGTLSERKNVVRLANAFARLGDGTLTFVGDGPLRDLVLAVGRPDVSYVGSLDAAGVKAALANSAVIS